MALLELATRQDLPAYVYSATLDGLLYTLHLRFNDRMGKWILAVHDAQDRPLLVGIPLVANWPLIDRFRIPGQPKGSLVAFDTSGQNHDPGRFDLGDRVKLFYLESASE